jgi:hypothetical protein
MHEILASIPQHQYRQ